MSIEYQEWKERRIAYRVESLRAAFEIVLLLHRQFREYDLKSGWNPIRLFAVDF